MSIEELRTICLKLPHVTEDIKWGSHLCFSIGGKMFIITSPDDVPVTASFKTSDEEFENLTSKEGFIPAPYLARNKWVYMEDISWLSDRNWEKYLKLAYDLVVARLPAKIKNQLHTEAGIDKVSPSLRSVMAHNKTFRKVKKRKTSRK